MIKIKNTNELFEKYPKTKITFIDKITGKTWIEWKEWIKCSEVEKQQANLRQLFPNEIILDIEDKNKLKEIIKSLKDKKWFYNLYDTGSRGNHIHLFFSNLDNLELDIRNAIRKTVIKEFECDVSKASEFGLIALEDKPHFKTGKNKTIIEVNEGINILTEHKIQFAKNEIEKENTLKTNILTEDIGEFKDYFEKDLFWLWLSKNIEKLPEHCEFNNIIAKNLAIACIKSKKSNNEIEQIIKPLIARRKWYQYDEFKGHLKRAKEKKVTDYNKYELNLWSTIFKNPIFYEETEGQEEIAKAFSIKQLWDSYWSENILGNEDWRDVLFYSLTSVILNEEDLDLRIHLAFIATTTVGKDLGINLVENILDSLDIKSQSINDITNAAIIGSYDDEINTQNRKKGLKLGDDKYRDPIVRGALYDCKLLAFPEAEIIFKPNMHARHVQGSLRSAMDEKRKIVKRTAKGEIEYNTNATIIFATYPEDYVVKDILKNGLFQRTLLLYKNITTEEQHKILDYVINKQHDYESRTKSSIYKKELIEKLKGLYDFWNINESKILKKQYENIDINRIKSKILNTTKTYKFLDDSDNQLLNAMAIRNSKKLGNIMLIKHILKAYENSSLTTNINFNKLIDETMSLYHKIMKNVSALVFETVNYKQLRKKYLDSNTNAIINIVKHNPEITRMELYEQMKNSLKIGENKCIKLTNELVVNQVLSEKQIGTKKFLVVSEDT